MSDTPLPKDRAAQWLAKLRRPKVIAAAIAVGTVIIAIGSFADALKKIADAWESFTDPKTMSVTGLQNLVLATADEAGREFASKTQGKKALVARSEFASTEKLLRRISRLDPGNGHAIYYTGLIMRWTGDRPGSHTVLYSYIARMNQSGGVQKEDDGSPKYCFEYWRGYCKERAAWLNHLLALDFSKDAAEATHPQLALEWRRRAIERAEAAIRLNGGFSDPGQGTPTRILLEEQRGEVAKAEGRTAGGPVTPTTIIK